MSDTCMHERCMHELILGLALKISSAALCLPPSERHTPENGDTVLGTCTIARHAQSRGRDPGGTVQRAVGGHLSHSSRLHTPGITCGSAVPYRYRSVYGTYLNC